MLVRYPYFSESENGEYVRIIPLQVLIIKPLDSKSKNSKSKRGVRYIVKTDVPENDAQRAQYLQKLQRIQLKQMQQWKSAPLAALKFQVDQFRFLGAEL